MRGFHLKLAAIATSGFAIRVLYALLVAKRAPLLGDARAFQSLAQNLVHAHGFRLQNPGHQTLRPTAEKPPLYPLLLAGVQAIKRGYVTQHIFNCACGAGTIVAIGLLGRRVGRETTGLLAAALAAVYPVLIVTDGSLRSESFYGLLIAVALVSAYRAWDEPTNGRFVTLGVVVGLSALARAEALLLLPLLGIPLALRARVTRLRVGALVCAGCVVVVVPWTVRNLLVFDRPVVISTNEASLVEGANCRASYYGTAIGEWAPQCVHRLAGDQAAEAAQQREQGLHYAGAHFARLPVVAAVRVLRTWGIYRPRLQWQEETFYEGRDLDWQKAGTFVYFVLVALAAVGLLILRRQRAPLFILAAPIVAVTLTSALGYGVIRFRMAAEIALVVLAAVTVAAGAGRFGARRRSRSGRGR